MKSIAKIIKQVRIVFKDDIVIQNQVFHLLHDNAQFIQFCQFSALEVSTFLFTFSHVMKLMYYIHLLIQF